MMTRLLEVSDTSYNILKDKYSSVIAELDELIQRYQANQTNDSEYESDEYPEQPQPEEKGSNPFIKLKKRIRQLP